jgi:hypothetical protein
VSGQLHAPNEMPTARGGIGISIDIIFWILTVTLNIQRVFTSHGLGPLACTDSELISETLNPFRHFGSIP